MSPLFGKGGQADRDRERRQRSGDEREDARREREARRAAREGREPVELSPLPPDLDRPAPPPPAAPETPAFPADRSGSSKLSDADLEPPGLPEPVQPASAQPAEEPASAPEHPLAADAPLAAEAPPAAEPPLAAEPPVDRSDSGPLSDADLEHPASASVQEASLFVWPEEEAPREEPPAPEPFPGPYHQPAPTRSDLASSSAADDPPTRMSRRASRRQRRDEAAAIDPEIADLEARGDTPPVGIKRVPASAVASSAGASPPPRFGAPPRGTPKRRRGRRAFPIAFLILVALVAFFFYRLYQPGKGEGSEPVTVTIPQGNSAEQIGDLLADKDVVASGFFFSLRARLDGGNLRSGKVELKRDMSYASALGELTKATPPAPKLAKITLPEGPSSRELAARVKAAGFKGSYVAAAKRTKGLDPRDFGAPKKATLEGFLFPATYELKPGSSAKALVAKQVTAFKSAFAKVDMKQARKRKLTKYDVLIIASMIEREAGVAKDRRLISGVIYNRLKQGMPLGIDATIRYDLDNFSRPLKVSELQKDTPYNTRTRTGLPPGPIGNPGLASIQAAANPAKNDFVYYVVKPCANGAHAFSSTDARFQQDVARYNKKRDELGGKDPSQC